MIFLFLMRGLEEGEQPVFPRAALAQQYGLQTLWGGEGGGEENEGGMKGGGYERRRGGEWLWLAVEIGV